MRLLVYIDGDYGLRILGNILLRCPSDWEIQDLELPPGLPPILEEPGEYVEGLVKEGPWDLVLFMGQSPSAFTLLPSLMRGMEARAVIAPVDDYSWLPLGLERQIKAELEELGVNVVFPRTFCTLTPVGEGSIDAFATLFGSPSLKVESEGGRVTSVEVARGAPCGSTWFMAEKLVGVEVDEASTKAGTLV